VKPVLLFAGGDYYPAGGWGDLIGTFDTVHEAKAHIDATRTTRTIPERVYTFDRRIVMSTGSSDSDHRTYEVGDKINGTDVVETVDGWMVTVRAPEVTCELMDYDWAHIVTGGEIVAELDSEGEWS
jgi:hypothetical protein